MQHWSRRRPLFVPPRVPRSRKKWRARFVLWNALKRTCMAIGAMVLLSSMISCTLVTVALRDAGGPVAMPEKTVLFMPLEAPYPEYREFAYGARQPTLYEVIEALDAARTDHRVKGVVASLRGAAFGPAQLYELRAAIKSFRESGKFAYFYVGSFAEQGQGMGSYYLAAAFDEIWMQPMGAVSLPGIKAEVPYAREMLGKLGVTADMFARKEYKSVFESFTDDAMSPASREALTAIVGDMALQMRADIAVDRGITPEDFQAQVDRGLLLAEEALAAGLVDTLGYGDNLTDTIKRDITGDERSEDVKFVEIGSYARHQAARKAKAATTQVKPTVALVYATGTIVPHMQKAGTAGPAAFFGGPFISATDMGATLMDATDDDDVKVIVIRIDSPGGSPVASETLRAKIMRAQERGKTVVVSMGETAASGGYWMVAPADRIFATPLTMTGSIGVAGGKFVLADLWTKIGVNWDSVEWGENAGIWSVNQMYTEAGRARYGALMDAVYDGFVARVAEGRDMELAQAEAVARGRVWTGLQAERHGLVDEIGGLTAALDYAATLAGAADRKGVTLQILPEPETLLDRLTRLMEMQAGIGHWFARVTTPARVAAQADGFMVYEPLSVR